MIATTKDEAIQELMNRRAVYIERNKCCPGLWDSYISDCNIMIDRLRRNRGLTEYQRGKRQ